MKKIALSLGALVAISSSGFAASEGLYLGAGLSAVSTSSAGINIGSEKDDQDRLGNFTFLAGYDINEFFAVEGRYTFSFAQEDLVQMDGWSIFAKPQYPITEDFSLYALLGYGGVNVNGTNGAVADVDESGFQWGLGADYDISENLSMFIDYTFLANDMDGIYWNGARQIDSDALTIGVTYRF